MCAQCSLPFFCLDIDGPSTECECWTACEYRVSHPKWIREWCFFEDKNLAFRQHTIYYLWIGKWWQISWNPFDFAFKTKYPNWSKLRCPTFRNFQELIVKQRVHRLDLKTWQWYWSIITFDLDFVFFFFIAALTRSTQTDALPLSVCLSVNDIYCKIHCKTGMVCVSRIVFLMFVVGTSIRFTRTLHTIRSVERQKSAQHGLIQ